MSWIQRDSRHRARTPGGRRVGHAPSGRHRGRHFAGGVERTPQKNTRPGGSGVKPTELGSRWILWREGFASSGQHSPRASVFSGDWPQKPGACTQRRAVSRGGGQISVQGTPSGAGWRTSKDHETERRRWIAPLRSQGDANLGRPPSGQNLEIILSQPTSVSG